MYHLCGTEGKTVAEYKSIYIDEERSAINEKKTTNTSQISCMDGMS